MKVQIPFAARQGIGVATRIAELAWRTLVYPVGDEPDVTDGEVLVPMGIQFTEPGCKTRLTAAFPMGMTVSVWLRPYDDRHGWQYEAVKVEARYYRITRGGWQDARTTMSWEGNELIAIEHLWGAYPLAWRDHPSTRL